LDVDKIKPWSHWITPEQERYRYDTYFYLTTASHTQATQAIHDAKETTQHDWLHPDHVLACHVAGQIRLAPPTWVLVSELAKRFTTFQSLQDELLSMTPRDMRCVLVSRLIVHVRYCLCCSPC
jgi:hypothetical protein